MNELMLLVGALVVYMLPSIIASIRKAGHDGAILMINLLFGWTVLGWIAALIWAVVEKPRKPYEPVIHGRKETWLGYSEPRGGIHR